MTNSATYSASRPGHDFVGGARDVASVAVSWARDGHEVWVYASMIGPHGVEFHRVPVTTVTATATALRNAANA